MILLHPETCNLFMHIIADLQLHSKYSRAVSKEMTIPGILSWAKKKGIGLIATGDWTHPLWFKEISENLEEIGNGFLRLKPTADSRQLAAKDDPYYLLATEVSCIYTQQGKGRRVHTLIWVPSLSSAEKINREMTKQGCNLMSDGRPIIGLSNIQLAELVLTIEPKALIIPAHAWTPWFSLYGSMSGFDSLDEAFGPYAKNIFAIETGLSSNPAMNWQIKELDNRSIVSFSDAHSGPKLGREATVFEFDGDHLSAFSYQHLYDAISRPWKKWRQKDSETMRQRDSDIISKRSESQSEAVSKSHISFTIEFYPEEGKYHYSGHRTCNIRWSPKETREKGTVCPVCGKPLIQGVAQRVEELAARTEEELMLQVLGYELQEGKSKIQMTQSKTFPDRPPFVMLVPLQEIIAECLNAPVTSKRVIALYDKLIETFKGEFSVLLSVTKEEIEKIAGERIAVGIEKVRKGDIVIDPGYDGVFGVVKLWREDEDKPLIDSSREQLSLL